MIKILPFGVLLPAALLLGFYLASLFGYSLPYGTPASTLLAALIWILLFLIIYGSLRAWKSVRVFLIIFVLIKFSAIAYRQMAVGIPFGRLMIELAGASILAWFMCTLFWPRKARSNQTAKSPVK